MGTCESTNNQMNVGKKESKNYQIREGINDSKFNESTSKVKVEEDYFFVETNPITENEKNELYSYESAMCKIHFHKTLENGQIENNLGTGFFCEIDDDNIPFKKALFTNHHILDEKNIEKNKEIVIEICGKIIPRPIIITENRKIFTNKELDYTCIQIFDTDDVNKLFKIDKQISNHKNFLINQEIFILQYPNSGVLTHACGKILDITDNKIRYKVSNEIGSSGSPLIKKDNINLIIGINFGTQKSFTGEISDNKFLCNIATPFDIIIKDIKNQFSNTIEYRNRINLIYEKNKEYNGFRNPNKIFGSKFVENNIDNIKLIINGKENKLTEEYNLKKGVNSIEIIIINKLTNLEYMFEHAISLKNIEGLKYLNTKDVNNFSHMFDGCISLSDIKPLQNWNVSNGKTFEAMFLRTRLWYTDKILIENWNLSENILDNMFEVN